MKYNPLLINKTVALAEDKLAAMTKGALRACQELTEVLSDLMTSKCQVFPLHNIVPDKFSLWLKIATPNGQMVFAVVECEQFPSEDKTYNLVSEVIAAQLRTFDSVLILLIAGQREYDNRTRESSKIFIPGKP